MTNEQDKKTQRTRELYEQSLTWLRENCPPNTKVYISRKRKPGQHYSVGLYIVMNGELISINEPLCNILPHTTADGYRLVDGFPDILLVSVNENIEHVLIPVVQAIYPGVQAPFRYTTI